MKLLVVSLSIFWAAAAVACAPAAGARALAAKTPAIMTGYASLTPITLSQPFDLQVFLCGAYAEQITRLEVAAIMPVHQHGMNYVPDVRTLGIGRFAVTGMVFHMPGHWEVQIAAFGPQDPQFFTLEVQAR